MKRLFLVTLSILLFSISNAQLISETIIGTTMYDVQSNLSSYNHISYNSDGTISAVWNYSPDSTTGFPNRGTGYNYFDGTNWGAYPTSRIEPSRTGFPSLVTTTSGHEVVLHHTGTAMALSYRPVKGTGSWTYSTPWGNSNNDTWAKTAMSGDSVYAIWNGSGTTSMPIQGQNGPIYFSASFDGGQTWSAKRIIQLIDSSYYYGWNGEDYSIDASGGTIAILYGNYGTDVGILKSQNAGLTWTKIIVDTHPVPFFGINTISTDTNADGIADLIITSSGDETILIDNDGMCHVWFTQIAWFSDSTATGTTGSLFDTDGIQYWNEAMGTDHYIKILNCRDFNGNGIIDVPLDPNICFDYSSGGNFYHTGPTGKPSAGIDANGTIFLAYQSVDEQTDTTVYGGIHSHAYVSTLPKIAGGYSPYNWTYPFDLARSIAQGGNGEFEENVLPSITRRIDGFAFVLYQRDLLPGLRSDICTGSLPNNPFINQIIVAKIQASTVGIKPVEQLVLTGFGVSPNPVQTNFTLQFYLNYQSDFTVNVTDLSGRLVLTERHDKVAKGLWKEEVSTIGLAPGVYLCSVVANGLACTERIVVTP